MPANFLAMQIEQLYTKCLALGTYYIESNGEAAIIDPLRDTEQYLELAKSRGCQIKYIFETHFHADFVSGHLTLSKQTGAPIIYGPTAAPKFDALVAEDEQVFPLGDIQITCLHTPGHTLESSCFLLTNKEGEKQALFSGDTLFLGDVGRPDLAQKAAQMTQEELAGTLYDSIQKKIINLPDDIVIYPGHGAGSACGKSMSKETVDTLGNQKRTNYALRADMTRNEFIQEVTDGLMPPPAYFPLNAQLNKEGYEDLTTLLENINYLNAEQFELNTQIDGNVVLDCRTADEFAACHIPKSIFVGIEGDFAPWAGTILKDTNTPLLVVANKHQVEECVSRLARVGFDNIIGVLDGGIDSWSKAGKTTDIIPCITAEKLHDIAAYQTVWDVRKASEYEAGHCKFSNNYPLSYLEDNMPERLQEVNVYCQGGYRSMIACSILKAKGVQHVVNVNGGYQEISKFDCCIS